MGTVLLTTGPWTAQTAAVLRGVVAPYRLHLAWYRLADAAAYAPDRSPVFLRQTADGLVFGFPSLDDRTAKVGLHATAADFGDSARVNDPDQLDHRVDGAAAEALGRMLATHLRGLDPEPERIRTYMDGYTADGGPVVDWIADNVWVLGGFSGHGFKTPAFGEVAAQLALHSEAQLPIGPFRRARFVR